MDNLKSPAYPLPIANVKEGEIMDTKDYCKDNGGFTKIERASLMIAQGLLAKYVLKEPADQHIIAELSVELATKIINKANL